MISWLLSRAYLFGGLAQNSQNFFIKIQQPDYQQSSFSPSFISHHDRNATIPTASNSTQPNMTAPSPMTGVDIYLKISSKRFKVLSEDKKQLFTELGTEFERRQIGSASDILKWVAYLGKKLKTPDLVDWPAMTRLCDYGNGRVATREISITQRGCKGR